jgi:hypothetical protein
MGNCVEVEFSISHREKGKAYKQLARSLYAGNARACRHQAMARAILRYRGGLLYLCRHGEATRNCDRLLVARATASGSLRHLIDRSARCRLAVEIWSPRELSVLARDHAAPA